MTEEKKNALLSDLGLLQEQIAPYMKREKLIKEYESEEKEIDSEIKSAEDSSKELNALLGKLDYDSFEKYLSENELGNVNDLQGELDAAEEKYNVEIKKETAKVVAGLDKEEKAISVCNSKIDDLKAQVRHLKEDKVNAKSQEERAKIQAQIDDFNRQIDALVIDRGKHAEQVTNYDNELKRLTAASDNSRKNIDAKQAELDAAKARCVERAKTNIQKDLDKTALKLEEAQTRLSTLKAEKGTDYEDAVRIMKKKKNKDVVNGLKYDIDKISKQLGIEPCYDLEEVKKEKDPKEEKEDETSKESKQVKAKSTFANIIADEPMENEDDGLKVYSTGNNKKEESKEEVASKGSEVKIQNDSEPVKTSEELKENINEVNKELNSADAKVDSEENYDDIIKSASESKPKEETKTEEKEETKEEVKEERKYGSIGARVIKVARHPLMALGYAKDRTTGKIPISVTVTEYIDKKLEEKEQKDGYGDIIESASESKPKVKVEEKIENKDEIKDEVKEAVKDNVTEDDVNAMKSTPLETSNKEESQGLQNTFTYTEDSKEGNKKEESTVVEGPEDQTPKIDYESIKQSIQAKKDSAAEKINAGYQELGQATQDEKDFAEFMGTEETSSQIWDKIGKEVVLATEYDTKRFEKFKPVIERHSRKEFETPSNEKFPVKKSEEKVIS